jgi:hypothetical protein
MSRIIDLNDKTLLQFGTCVNFNNRALKSELPTNGPLGVYHRGLAVLNFDPLSSIRGKAPSIWDGFWTGLNIFQMITGMVNGTSRCYAFCFNAVTVEIELWEIEPDSDTSFDNGTTPITWSFESAMLFSNVKGKGALDFVELIDGEINLRDIRGVVNVQSWWRPDYSECWQPWHDFTICAANDAATDPKQFRTRLGLGEPEVTFCDPTNDRPYRIGTSFQVRFQFTGSAKFMAGLFKATPSPNTKFSQPICDPLCDTIPSVTPCEPCKTETPCLRFDPVFYSLGNGKSYSNTLQSYDVVCDDGSIGHVFIQPGTINFTLPYPIPFDGVYPPLVLGCVGGNIVRNLPSGATQTDADVIINEMIQACAQATANALIASGEAECDVSAICNSTNNHQYTITPYADGDVINATGPVPTGGEFIFQGNLPYKTVGGGCIWISNINSGQEMLVNGKKCCVVTILFTSQIWRLSFLLTAGVVIWRGEKTTGSSPAGVYTNTGAGLDGLPLTLTVVQGSGTTTDQQSPSCGVA